VSLVIDASVAAKWFFNEPHDDEARQLLARRDQFNAPALILAEVANIIWKRHRKDEIGSQHAHAAIQALGYHLPQLYPLDILSERAIAIAIALDHPAYDCFYLACAEMTGGIVITADRRFQKAVEETPFDGHVMGLEDAHDP
jgi:predicted nucleic acid-binding protein